ncbi:MAG: DUF4838 domain-containing protein [Candidatus Binataceae bacterium]
MLRPMHSDEVTAVAADELASGLAAMLGAPVALHSDAAVAPRELRVQFGHGRHSHAEGERRLVGDAFAVTRSAGDDGAIILRAGSTRGLAHAAADLLERMGAAFPVGCAPRLPHLDWEKLRALSPYRVEPSFQRRAFVSDIMTWNYAVADRLALHLRHDREFIPWMARRGANAFSFIRHAHDTRLRIDELAPVHARYGIEVEYGGHILQILMPRDEFAKHPEYFPADDNGARLARGNLCVSSRDAMKLVTDGALRYVAEFPENRLLHVWGADVWNGAWCKCGDCAPLSPQLQYMKVVNAVAAAMAENGAGGPPVAYLAYHDTIEPDPALKPLDVVWFEWAPRERCYGHAIDDSSCGINPRYLHSLARYIELFGGRGHVFEYYADAVLFGGISIASPDVIVRDMRAYRRLGIESISCLTFGAYSALAYPANLETFVAAARSTAIEASRSSDAAADGRHPACAAPMRDAYRALERASALVLDYADVMRPQTAASRAAAKRVDASRAARLLGESINALERTLDGVRDLLASAELAMWKYSRDALDGISAYFGALESAGAERSRRGNAAIEKIAAAVEHVRAIDLEIKGTWGAYDLEWIRELWLDALRRGLDDKQAPRETI